MATGVGVLAKWSADGKPSEVVHHGCVASDGFRTRSHMYTYMAADVTRDRSSENV